MGTAMSQRCFGIAEDRRYDVVVVGGGTTDIAAAIAAVREVARMVLVDCLGFLGDHSATIPALLGFLQSYVPGFCAAGAIL